jgi:diguanylate cyclase (GGDEF)-like protein
VLSLAATAGIVGLRGEADDHRRGQVLLSQVQTYGARQNVEVSAAAGLGIVAGGKGNATLKIAVADLPGKIEALQRQTDDALSEIGRLGLPTSEFARLKRASAEYEATLAVGIARIRRGDYDNAWIYDRERVDPAAQEFRGAVDRANGEYAQLAEGATLVAEVGTFSAVLLSLLALALLRWRAEKQRVAYEKELAYQAFHDPLTQLANRTLLKDRLELAVERVRRGKDSLALLFVDLDGFKVVNDTLGHETGDELLVAVAERLMKCTRTTDTVARLGGDEFAILLEDLKRPENATEVAGRIIRSLEDPVLVAGESILAGASIGISLSDLGDESAEEHLINADIAMYRAKAAGKSRYEIFRSEMRHALTDRLSLIQELERGVLNGELVLHYQPVVDLATGQPVEVEALVRWEHPQRGLIYPGDFIPLAEGSNLIVDLGRWVLKEACAEARRWQPASDGRPLRVGVNLSARQFQDTSLVSDVYEALSQSGLDPDRLLLEITESTLMQDTATTVERMMELKRIGVRLAVDDFGIGYSSLSYLQRFPIDVLKIDKSFVDRVAEGAEDAAFPDAIVRLARTLSLEVVAEGIERAEQASVLREMDCRRGQGFLFSKPLSPEELRHVLASTPASHVPSA